VNSSSYSFTNQNHYNQTQTHQEDPRIKFFEDRYFLKDNTEQFTIPELAFDLIFCLTSYGLKPGKTDIETLLVAVDAISSCDIAYRLAWQFIHNCNIWSNTSALTISGLELFYSRILKILLDNMELERAKQVLTLMRTLNILPVGSIKISIDDLSTKQMLYV